MSLDEGITNRGRNVLPVPAPPADYIRSGLVSQAPEAGGNVEITAFGGYWQENTVAIRKIVSNV